MYICASCLNDTSALIISTCIKYLSYTMTHYLIHLIDKIFVYIYCMHARKIIQSDIYI